MANYLDSCFYHVVPSSLSCVCVTYRTRYKHCVACLELVTASKFCDESILMKKILMVVYTKDSTEAKTYENMD